MRAIVRQVAASQDLGLEPTPKLCAPTAEEVVTLCGRSQPPECLWHKIVPIPDLRLWQQDVQNHSVLYSKTPGPRSACAPRQDDTKHAVQILFSRAFNKATATNIQTLSQASLCPMNQQGHPPRTQASMRQPLPSPCQPCEPHQPDPSGHISTDTAHHRSKTKRNDHAHSMCMVQAPSARRVHVQHANNS